MGDKQVIPQTYIHLLTAICFSVFRNGFLKLNWILLFSCLEENSVKLVDELVHECHIHRLIDATKHHILKAAHPSGLSANRGFFGCR